MEEAWELAVVKIFASWSGDHSKEIAKCFADWLPKVIQGSHVFISPRIPSGEGWFDTIMSNLKESDYGIAFVTAENVQAPWLHFESGALALKFDKARISPVLCNIDNTGLPSRNPLSNFQAVELDQGGLYDLLKSILQKIDRPSLKVDDLQETLSKWEKEFFDQIEKINASIGAGENDSDNKEELEDDELKDILSDVLGEVRSLSSRVDQISRPRGAPTSFFGNHISPSLLALGSDSASAAAAAQAASASAASSAAIAASNETTTYNTILELLSNAQTQAELAEIEELISLAGPRLNSLAHLAINNALQQARARLGDEE